ncbi:uncharacterized protein DS421_10g300700 [Arachis hypogaea]|nr:uncharacterized protein DS421_10g300700 [Arachis hypogaea]
MKKVAPRRLPCPCGGQGRNLCMRLLVRASWALMLAGCCPALVEGRAEIFGVPDLLPRACAMMLPKLLGAPILCACVHHQNAALPLWRAGQCAKAEALRSKLG